MLVQTEIKNLIDEIVSGYQPEKIYLFGSYSINKQTSESDIDLLIIKETSDRKIERNREVRRCIKIYPRAGLDVFILTPLELQQSLKETMNIAKEAITTGKLLYERI